MEIFESILVGSQIAMILLATYCLSLASKALRELDKILSSHRREVQTANSLASDAMANWRESERNQSATETKLLEALTTLSLSKDGSSQIAGQFLASQIASERAKIEQAKNGPTKAKGPRQKAVDQVEKDLQEKHDLPPM